MVTSVPPMATPPSGRDARAADVPDVDYGLRHWSGWLFGPACLLVTLMAPPPDGLSSAGWRTAGVAGLMAVLWITEAIPIPVTALLPLVLLPVLGLAEIKDAAAPYANPIIYLFLGGFLIALAMQRWHLHRRVAIALIGAMGTHPRRIIGGFLVASAAVSMWVSNTATALMMLPIATSVLLLVSREGGVDRHLRGFDTALMLSVAYGATAGGMATLIGTPPNALLAAYLSSTYGVEIGFARWMLLGVPVTVVAVVLVHVVLTRVSFRLSRTELPGMADLLAAERARLGPPTRGELATGAIFLLTAAGWVGQPLIARFWPLVTDTTVAMAGAIALFLVPVDARRGRFVLDWQTARAVPWDVLVLFGGGLSLAASIDRHGLAAYIGSWSAGLHGVPLGVAVAIVCFLVLMLTELTSNTATAATFLPIVAATALGLGQNPLLLLAPAALAANCAFMLPVGTPPNAIVFSSGRVPLPAMARAGLLLNLGLVPVLVGLVWWIGPLVFDIRLDTVPSWAR